MVPTAAEGLGVDASFFLVNLLAGHRAEEIPVTVIEIICMGLGVAASSFRVSTRFVFLLVRNTALQRQVAAHWRACRRRAPWAAIHWRLRPGRRLRLNVSQQTTA